MTYILMGKPIYTNCGTYIKKYIKNGKLYKSISFFDSTNKIAKQQGLLKRVVTYNKNKIPVEFTDIIERNTVLPVKDTQQTYPEKYSSIYNIKYKTISNVKETSRGTKILKYIEDGKLYKSIWFEDSTNKVAKEQGLLKTKVKYGANLKPAEIQNTYKKTYVLPVKENKKQDNTISASKETKKESDNSYLGNLGEDRKKSFCEAYRKTDRSSVFYQDYDLFISNVKSRLQKYEKFLPKELYQDIMTRYGYEEMSIKKIMQDNSFDIEEMQIKPSQKTLKNSCKNLLANTEKKEQEFAKIRLADKSEKLSVVYTNAWTHSKLRVDMGYETTKRNGNPWSILKEVWSKRLNPDESKYKTENLIDAYLIRMYSNRYQTGIMSFNEENPLLKIAEDKELSRKKVSALKVMYSGVNELETFEYKRILESSDYQEFKNTADTDAMAKTIESIEEHYTNAFLKYFWTEERKFRFSEVLKNEIKDFDEKIELSNDIYNALLKYSSIN